MRSLLLLIGAFVALFVPTAGAQDDVHARAEVCTRVDGTKIQVVIQVAIERDWHLYHGPTREDMGPPDAVGKPTKIALRGEGIRWSPVRYPTPKRLPQEIGNDGKPTYINGYDGVAVFYALGEADRDGRGGDIEIEIDGLTCEDLGMCVPYTETLRSGGMCDDALLSGFPTDLVVGAANVPSDAGTPSSTDVESTSSNGSGAVTTASSRAIDYAAVEFADYQPNVDEATHGLGIWLLLAFIAGVLLNVMPCVLPVVSIKILSFVQQAGESRSRILQLGLAFSAGILVVFVVLAALAAFAGKGWGEQFQSPNFIVVMIAVVFAFSLSMFDVFELGVPSGVGNLGAGMAREGLGDAFFKGAMATVLATPCSGPFLGSTLAWSVAQPTATIFLIFVVIGLGMAAPYVLLTANPAALKLVPRPGAWMQTFKHLMGFLLLGTVVYLMTSLRQDLLLFTVGFLLFVAIGCWWWGRFATFDQKLGARLTTLGVALAIVAVGARLSFVDLRKLFSTGGGELEWVEFDPVALERHHAEGRTVFVDFTANWCPNCKYNEFNVFESEEIRALMDRKGVVAMKADITNEGPRTEMIRKLMKELGYRSIPLCAVFPGDRPHQPFVRPDIVTVSTMRAIFEACPDPPSKR
ncbi:MAG: thioredoxin family protein [Planctomycetota bacterium]